MGGRCYRRLPPTAVAGLGLDARRQRKKAFAQSERARVRGLCRVSPSPVLVRRQPFIGPVGQGCRWVFSYTLTSYKLDSSNRRNEVFTRCVGHILLGEMACRRFATIVVGLLIGTGRASEIRTGNSLRRVPIIDVSPLLHDGRRMRGIHLQCSTNRRRYGTNHVTEPGICNVL